MSRAERPAPDPLLLEIADYAVGYRPECEEARDTAMLCLMDSLACMFQALEFPACTRLLGPVVPGAALAGGARVPGTSFELDPVQAAFNIGTLVRWLDFNDTWLAAEWGHPSDNLGGLLAVGDWLARQAAARGEPPPTVGHLLDAMIKAHEIQGVLALENAFNRVGLDHVLLVRIATAAVAAAWLGGSREQVWAAVANAWLDGGALRAYRHAPNTGSRKSWAAGDATSRGVRLALLALAGEMGYPSALSAPRWGFQEVLFAGREVRLARPLASYVMEHVLFKISYPAEFHAQTAVEAAVTLHPEVAPRLEAIERIAIDTQEPAVRIIDKTGPLANPADRDHCLQYMTAVALLQGALTAADYEDEAAADPRLDALRARMQVREEPRYTRDYYDPDKRAIANAVQVFFTGGERTQRVEVEYPVGHPRRRAQGRPLLFAKFDASVRPALGERRFERLAALFADRTRLEAMPIQEWMAALVR